LIGLRIKEKDLQKAKWILQRFKIPFKQEQGSVVFRLLDDYNAVDLLFYLKRMGMKAKLTQIL